MQAPDGFGGYTVLTSAADIPRLRRSEQTETSEPARTFTYAPHPAAGAAMAPLVARPASPAKAAPTQLLWDRRYRSGPDHLDWPLPAMQIVLPWPAPAQARTPPSAKLPGVAPLEDETRILASLEALEMSAATGQSAFAPESFAPESIAPESLAPASWEAPAPVAERAFAPTLPLDRAVMDPPFAPTVPAPAAAPAGLARSAFAAPSPPPPSDARPRPAIASAPPEPPSWFDNGGYADVWSGDAEESPAAVRDRARPSRARVVVAGLAALAVAAAAAAAYRHDWSQREETALFNAPMMVIKAAGPGRVAAVTVAPGQAVQAGSALLSLQDGNVLRKPILAGVNGVVRSVEVQPGTDVVRGSPLMRLYDCDHAFLTLPDGSKAAAGQSIRVSIAGQPTFTATVRPSAGVAEPVNAVVVGVPAGALAAACPVGATARVDWTAKATS